MSMPASWPGACIGTALCSHRAPIASLLSAPHQHHTQERSSIEEGALPRALYYGRFEFLFSYFLRLRYSGVRRGEGRSEGRAKERMIFGKRRLPPQLFKMCSKCHWKCGNKWGPCIRRECAASAFSTCFDVALGMLQKRHFPALREILPDLI